MSAPAAGTTPAIGSIAPDFTTRNQHGADVTLSSLRGQPVVIVFYPFAFTGICTSELCELRDNLGDFEGLGATVLAVSTDTIFTLRVFAEREGFTFDLLSDHWPHGSIAQAYGVFDSQIGCALRGTFVLDAEGTVVWSVLNSIGDARQVTDALNALAAA